MTRGRRGGSATGFTLIEVLIAAVVGLAALVVIAPLLQFAGASSRTVPATADIDQRLRAAVAFIERTLTRAGEGFAAGPHAGPLAALVPSVFPQRRRVDSSSDPPLTAVRDRITVWRSDGSLARATLSTATSTGADPLSLWWAPPCAATIAACRFAADDQALVHDRLGRFAAFRVEAPVGGSIGHAPADLGLVFAIADDPQVARLHATTIAFDAATGQLRAGSGAAETPLIDHVVAFEVRYFGDPEPPRVPTPPMGTPTCLFDATGLSLLPTLATDDGPWVELSLALLSDGPTCGSGASAFDADLLRIRRVRVRLRLEAVDERLRGQDPVRFTRPGRARSTAVSADREVVIDVAPRNLQWP